MKMVTIKIDPNTKQAQEFLKYVKTLSFVEVLENNDVVKEQEAFYYKFHQSVQEAKKISSGEQKGIPLKETLDEI